MAYSRLCESPEFDSRLGYQPPFCGSLEDREQVSCLFAWDGGVLEEFFMGDYPGRFCKLTSLEESTV